MRPEKSAILADLRWRRYDVIKRSQALSPLHLLSLEERRARRQ